jgi:hypothetical protein
MVKASMVVNSRKIFVMTKNFQTVLTLRSSDLSQWFGSCKLDHGELPYLAQNRSNVKTAMR